MISFPADMINEYKSTNKKVFSRSWQAESVDSGCSNSTAFTTPCSEGLCAEGICITTGGRCDQPTSKLATVKVCSIDNVYPTKDSMTPRALMCS